MAHELEIKADGKASMAFAGEVPWHGLGKEVPPDLTSEQMLKAAGLDWEVRKVPAYADINGRKVPVHQSALVRSSDDRVLDVVSNDWNPVQNSEAFGFFHEFVMAGDMEMNTAGSLRGGQVVWGLAKVKDSFEPVKGDRIDAYLLFTNFHRFGFATDVRFTPIRVVCNNTLTLSLSSQAERMVKISHRTKFNPDEAKEMLGIAHGKMNEYKEMAEFLGTKRPGAEAIIDYFKTVWPVAGKDSKKTISKNAATGIGLFGDGNTPGSEFAPGSFWQLFNTVTYMTDHTLSRTQDSRLYYAWYGYNKSLKVEALKTAVKMAEVA